MEDSTDLAQQQRLFTKLSSKETGLEFVNRLEESENFDVFRYRNYYNGAGVSIGDVNNDGLADIYLTANSDKNKLFLNLGNFKFKDITLSAGVGGTRAWSTGVSMVDVNGDGLLDIYVCNSGDVNGRDMENELFINNGNLTFTERAKELGLDDKGFSTHAVFFDYDKDGDLDCYLLNNSFRPASTLGYRNIRDERDDLGGDKLLRNDNGLFKDVSQQAGIYGSVIGFGLGVTVGDLNHDSWPDIYVANDFFERDYLYINNQNGSFSERLEEYMGHTSMFSMGADIADLNNDGYLDILSTDMLPKDDYRLKTVASFESYDLSLIKIKNGYYHQYMRNMLQLNNQDGTFSEVGQLAGVSATDWSWGALIADFNNDGTKDIFISNGIYRDVTNLDFLDYMVNEENVRAALEGRKIDYQKVIKDMPSNKLSNFMFTKDGNLHYTNVSQQWGLDEPGFSNGSAYGDLDNDGDLDLVINNVNQELFIYRNELRGLSNNNYLAVTFKGSDKNSFGLGAKVEVFKGSEIICNENMPIRGYQSSMDYKMIIGLGASNVIDSMAVTWPNEKVQYFTHVQANQQIEVSQKNATVRMEQKARPPLESSLLKEIGMKLNFRHKENEYNEFNTQRSLANMLSSAGPALAVADLNNDKLDDFYIGGASGQAGAIFIQNRDGSFKRLMTNTFDPDSVSEDVDAVFLDVDNDNDLDLYVVSGGSEFEPLSNKLQDRLYINSGIVKSQPTFVKNERALPALKQNGSCVRTADYDHDGDVDIFLGTRSVPQQYGILCDQYILENRGGQFINVTDNSPDLEGLGMVMDAQWFDYDADGLLDIMVVGEWMPITVLRNTGKSFQRIQVAGLNNTQGWWNTIEKADVDNDGDLDFLLGNLGLNTKYKSTEQNPISLYVCDFDQNSSLQQIYTYSKNGIDYPFSLRQDLSKQINSINKKFVYYRDYAGKPMKEVFDSKQLKRASVYRSYKNQTSVLINNGDKGFTLNRLPLQAQFAPIYSINILDLNADGLPDLVLGGNMSAVRPEVGRYDASYGLVLLGDGKGDFEPLSSAGSGLVVKGEVRNIEVIAGLDQSYLLFALNNDSLKYFKIRKNLQRNRGKP